LIYSAVPAFNSATEAAIEVSCPTLVLDASVLLQTAVRGSFGQDILPKSSVQSMRDLDMSLQATKAVQLNQVGKVERSLHTLTDAGEEVRAARSYTNAAIGFEAQAAESLKLAYEEAQQAEGIQEARAYKESNITQILHDAVQQLQHLPIGPDNLALLQMLRKAEVAQAAMIEDASQEDQALAALRQTMATAAQAATTAKLVDESQTSETLDDAIARIKEVQGDQLEHAKQTIQLAKSFEGIPSWSATRLQESEQKQLQTRLLAAELHGKKLEAELARASDAAAEHHSADVARQQASAMYKATSSSQIALEAQTAKTARSLMLIAQEAAESAKVLSGAITSEAAADQPLMVAPLRP
jgi:hypothetical protein